MVIVAQLVRAPGCGPGGRGFKSLLSPHFILNTGTSGRLENPYHFAVRVGIYPEAYCIMNCPAAQSSSLEREQYIFSRLFIQLFRQLRGIRYRKHCASSFLSGKNKKYSISPFDCHYLAVWLRILCQNINTGGSRSHTGKHEETAPLCSPKSPRSEFTISLYAERRGESWEKLLLLN